MSVFKIHHVTRYEYDRPVKESHNEVKIFPYQCTEQEVLKHELNITHSPDVQRFFDYWGNETGVFSVLPPHRLMVIESKLVVRTLATTFPNIYESGSFEDLHIETDDNLKMLELSTADFIKLENEIDNIIAQVYTQGATVASVVQNCSEYIFANYKYVKGITNVQTTVDEILQHKSGVCQDFAHVMLQVLRKLHIPGRYVSGYICPNKNGMRGEGATHAWVEAWIPGYGWAGIDPTNNVWVTAHHVKLAVGRHFKDCSPVKGTFKGPAKQNLSVFVSVSYEDGQVFEDLQDVALSPEAEAGHEEDLIFEGAGAQQQ